MTNPTLFEQMMDAPPEIGVYVGVPAFCDFPVYTIPLTDEAVEMLGERFAGRRPPVEAFVLSEPPEIEFAVGARPEPPPGSIEEAFDLFHEANPWVYDHLVRLARDLRERGRQKVGIGMLTEILRWSYLMQTDDPTSDFKINNNYRSRFARKIMAENPDLAGIFETRELKAR